MNPLTSLTRPFLCFIMCLSALVANDQIDIETLRSQAAGGDVKAQFDLAHRYRDGKGVPKTKETGVSYRLMVAAEDKLKPAEEKTTLEKLRLQGLSERKHLVLEKGISNLEFHYLGSAKILGGIGKGLAEAMAELEQL